MNKSEQKALEWLINKGVSEENIIRSRHLVYDFWITTEGFFEVKTIYEYKTQKQIQISQKQKVLGDKLNPTYMLFSKSSKTPIFVGKLEEIPLEITKYVGGKNMMNKNETENVMDEPITVKVSLQLIESVKKKLGLHPATPACIIADTALREFAKEA